MKYFIAILLLSTFNIVQAAMVEFNGAPSTSWADGTFTYNLYNTNDGFFNAGTPYEAANGYGMSVETIQFSQPVVLNSFDIMPFVGHIYWAAVTTVSEYNSAGQLLAQQFDDPNASTWTTFNVELSNVSAVQFTFSSPYANGPLGNANWYLINNVTYNEAVPTNMPEPNTIILLALGLLSFGFIRMKKVHRMCRR